MKRIIGLALVAVALSACSPSETIASPSASPHSSPTPIWTPSASASVDTAVDELTCDDVTLTVPLEWGSGAECRIVAEQNGEDSGMGFPRHVSFSIEDSLLGERAWVSILPIDAYVVIDPYVSRDAERLQDLMDGVETLPGPYYGQLPVLPGQGAGVLFFSNYLILGSPELEGIRFLGQFTQGGTPSVNNSELFYVFQGLSQDGRYWISAILHVAHPGLPAEPDYSQGLEDEEGYVLSMVDWLNSQPDDTFLPSLEALDALIQSISVAR